MIDFTPEGHPEVWFKIIGGDHYRSSRTEVRMSLDEFIVLARTTKTLEELRMAVLGFDVRRGRPKTKVMGVGE